MDLGIRGRTALVCAASKGLGKGCATSLAREGVKFTQAYACPVCSPSRVSLLTGMNAARHRVTNWTLRKDTTTDEQHSFLRFPEWQSMGYHVFDV